MARLHEFWLFITARLLWHVSPNEALYRWAKAHALRNRRLGITDRLAEMYAETLARNAEPGGPVRLAP